MPTTPDVTDTSWDSLVVQEATADARNMIAGEHISQTQAHILADYVLRLAEEIRNIRQAHSDALEAYSAMRQRVRDAIDADDHR